MSVQALSAVMAVRGVSASEKLVLIVLANFADDNMRAWPSHKRLAEDACITERTVLSVLKGLEARGLIERKEQRRKDGSRTSDLITLRVGGEIISPRGENDGEGVGKQFPQGGEMVSPPTTFEPSLNHQIDEQERGAPVALPAPKRRPEPMGQRLPESWTPKPDYQPADFGLSHEQHSGELLKFLDYWRSVPGAKGRKLDWDATWRNWMRRAAENLPRQPHGRHEPPRPDAKRLAREANLARAFAGSEAAMRERSGR